jgi:adenylate cyclase
MPDIFISYSRKDSEQATMLAEMLASAGLSCWIDQQGIEAAASWSAQIVDAINGCKVFIALLSPTSIESHNVIKEISLASEKRKKILPLDLEPVTLPRELEYQLAGIQRAPMTNIDSIIRALGKLGLEATGAPQAPKIVKESDGRKSLMILPFEDLSPTGDNGWFADGIASELITALSNVKALRVSDQQTTKDYKRYQGTLPNFAKEMGIRYFIQGDVRKFGDNIKITSRLLDVETGDHLWQESLKGTMEDIFDIQEKVAEKVVEGLKVHLAASEKKKLAERGTENVEAYELNMKAGEYFARQTKEGFLLAAQLLTEAIRLDRNYALAYQLKAIALTTLCERYGFDPTLLNEAEALCKEALLIKPDLFAIYQPLSMIYLQRGKLAEAEEFAQEYIRKDPDNFNSHFSLAYFCSYTGQYARGVALYEKALSLKPDNLNVLWNLAIASDDTGDPTKTAQRATVALPYYERYLKLHPDDENNRVSYAALLLMAGRTEAAHEAAIKLTSLKDGGPLYNVACLFGIMGDKEGALATCRKAIEAGYKSTRFLNEFLTNEKEGVASLAGTPEYEQVKRMVQAIEAERDNA